MKKFSYRSIPFEFNFGKKLNSEWSLATDNLKFKLILDEQNLERDHLTAKHRRELSDSRPRNKVVRKGYQSRGISPKVDRSDRNTPYYRSLEQLAKSANEWMIWKKNLTLEKKQPSSPHANREKSTSTGFAEKKFNNWNSETRRYGFTKI